MTRGHTAHPSPGRVRRAHRSPGLPGIGTACARAERDLKARASCAQRTVEAARHAASGIALACARASGLSRLSLRSHGDAMSGDFEPEQKRYLEGLAVG